MCFYIVYAHIRFRLETVGASRQNIHFKIYTIYIIISRCAARTLCIDLYAYECFMNLRARHNHIRAANDLCATNGGLHCVCAANVYLSDVYIYANRCERRARAQSSEHSLAPLVVHHASCHTSSQTYRRALAHLLAPAPAPVL